MVITNTNIRRVGYVPPFWIRRVLLRCTLLLIVVAVSLPTAAHDPGLSAAKLVVEEHSIIADLTFARGDIELLIPLDLNGDDHVSSRELQTLELQLHHLAQDLVVISSDKVALRGSVLGVNLDSSDAMTFTLEYVRPIGTGFLFSAQVLPEMVLGHRQFVTIMQQGQVIQTEILSAAKTDAEVHLAAIGWWRQILHYVWEGAWHIWIGYDHILFLIAMLLPAALIFVNGAWRPRDTFRPTFIQVVKIVSAFTVAHSITLSLSVFNLIRLDTVMVESVIAASVIFAAANNLRPFIREHLWVMSFAFGLIHGLGFASVLSNLGLPDGAKGVALLGFNIGVELGQLAIIVAILPLIFLFRDQRIYHLMFLKTGSVAISVIASVWLLERIFGWNFFATI